MNAAETILDKTTWYDLVSIITPGCALFLKIEISGYSIYATKSYINNASNDSTLRVILLLLFALALGILIHVVGKIIFDPVLRNRNYLIKAAAFSVKRKLERDDIPSNVKDYYDAYSKVVSAGKSKGISSMEAQISCLKSFCIILPLLFDEKPLEGSLTQTDFFLYPLGMLSLISLVLIFTSFVRLLCGIIPKRECYPPIEILNLFVFIIFVVVYGIKSMQGLASLLFSEFVIIALIFYIQYSIHRLILEEYPFCAHNNAAIRS